MPTGNYTANVKKEMKNKTQNGKDIKNSLKSWLAHARRDVHTVSTLEYQYNEINDFQSDGTGLIRCSTLGLCLNPNMHTPRWKQSINNRLKLEFALRARLLSQPNGDFFLSSEYIYTKFQKTRRKKQPTRTTTPYNDAVFCNFIFVALYINKLSVWA